MATEDLNARDSFIEKTDDLNRDNIDPDKLGKFNVL